jgi:hypothetical protein
MRFVVPIPLWLYLAFALVAFSVGVTALYIVLVFSFIYMLISQPRQVIGFLFGICVLAAAFKYWRVMLMVLPFALVVKYMLRRNEVLPHEKKLIGMNGAKKNRNQS